MSQAEELLNSMSEEETVAEAAVVDTEPHIVIGTDKFITVPPELRKIAVQHEHNVKTVTFDCPRYWDGRDLMDMVIYINYKTPNNVPGQKEVENVTVDPDDDTLIHFDWPITRNVTQMNGTLSFLACGIKLDDNGMEDQHWNSELNREMTISEGLECATSILESYPDVITDMLVRLRKVEAGDVTFDETLTLSGYAADAKAVGDALAKQKLLLVTLDDDGYASHSASEILEHIDNGGTAILEFGSPVQGYAHFKHATNTELMTSVVFSWLDVFSDSVRETWYGIDDDKKVSEESNEFKSSGSGGSNLLIVTLDKPNGTADYNATEIISHVESGGIVLLKNPVDVDNPGSVEAGYIPLSGITSGFVMFKGVEVYEDRTVQYLYTIMPDASYTMEETTINHATDQDGEVSLIDFSNFENGSFTETVDGEVIAHTTTFDDQGRLIAIDSAEVRWGSSE